MIYAIMIGRKGSRGFPGKNLKKINGKRLCEYPLIAANKSSLIKGIFVSTDCPKIKQISKKYKATVLDRPKRLSSSKALGDHVFENAYFQVKKKVKNIKYLILLFANAPLVNENMINEGIKILNKNKKFDSAVSTSIYNMWSPLRARKLDKNGCLKPFVKFNYFGDPKKLNCDRDSQGDVYFADMSLSVVRPKCLENLSSGLLPQKWMGKNIAPIKTWGGFDIDYEWQMPLLKYRLKFK